MNVQPFPTFLGCDIEQLDGVRRVMQLWPDERVVSRMPDESRAIDKLHDNSPIHFVSREVAGDAAQKAPMRHGEAFLVLKAEPPLSMLRR